MHCYIPNQNKGQINQQDNRAEKTLANREIRFPLRNFALTRNTFGSLAKLKTLKNDQGPMLLLLTISIKFLLFAKS